MPLLRSAVLGVSIALGLPVQTEVSRAKGRDYTYVRRWGPRINIYLQPQRVMNHHKVRPGAAGRPGGRAFYCDLFIQKWSHTVPMTHVPALIE